jgi:hypothetical protein
MGQSSEPAAATLPPLTAETIGCPKTAGVAEPAPTADVTVEDCLWLVVSEGTTDGKPWRVVAMAVGDELSWWLELEYESTGSMVSGRIPIISAEMRADPHVAYGVVGPQVSRVLLETTGADVDLTVVPLSGIGAEAGAFAEPVPPGTEVEWFVALAADGSELDRLVGPAAAPWASQEPAASPAGS